MTTTGDHTGRPRGRRPWLNLLLGLFFSLLLTFFGFLVLRTTELSLRLALAPFVIGPLIWPMVFYLSTDLRGRGRRVVFMSLMAAHYVGLAWGLWREESYEWGFYLGAFKFAFPQLLVYLWVQFVLLAQIFSG